MIEGCEGFPSTLVVATDLQAEGPLPHGWPEVWGGEYAGHAMAETESLEPGRSQHQAVACTFIKLPQAGVDVTTDR